MKRAFITKIYKIDNLADDYKERIELISRVEIRPKTTFVFQKNTVTRYSKVITGYTLPYGQCNARQLKSLAEYLDYTYSIGLIHGDIKKDNVIFTRTNAYVIDWEPSLFQVIDGRRRLVATYPYVDRQDLINRRVSFRTDLLGFVNIMSKPEKEYFQSPSWEQRVNVLLKSPRPFTKAFIESDEQ